MKRIYKTVSMAAVATGHEIHLDGRPVRTPQSRSLTAPTPQLAQAIVEEWAAQAEHVRPHSMPMTSLLATALDRTAPDRQRVVTGMVGFAQTDLICYRATHPDELVRRQDAVWQPLLEWAEARFGARLRLVDGVMPIPQPDSALAALAEAVGQLDPFRLTGLGATAGAAGSLVIGLAMLEGRLTAEAAFAASQVDELFQIERWGEDEEAADHRAQLLVDFCDAGRFLSLIAAAPSAG